MVRLIVLYHLRLGLDRSRRHVFLQMLGGSMAIKSIAV